MERDDEVRRAAESRANRTEKVEHIAREADRAGSSAAKGTGRHSPDIDACAALATECARGAVVVGRLCDDRCYLVTMIGKRRSDDLSLPSRDGDIGWEVLGQKQDTRQEALRLALDVPRNVVIHLKRRPVDFRRGVFRTGLR